MASRLASSIFELVILKPARAMFAPSRVIPCGLGAIAGPSWGHHGAITGPSRGHHGAILGDVGPSWSNRGAILGHLGWSWGHLGSSWVPAGIPKITQTGFTMAPGRPKIVHGGAKMIPIWPPDRPRWPHDGPKTAPTMAPRPPRMTRDGATMTRDGFKIGQFNF